MQDIWQASKGVVVELKETVKRWIIFGKPCKRTQIKILLHIASTGVEWDNGDIFIFIILHL